MVSSAGRSHSPAAVGFNAVAKSELSVFTANVETFVRSVEVDALEHQVLPPAA